MKLWSSLFVNRSNLNDSSQSTTDNTNVEKSVKKSQNIGKDKNCIPEDYTLMQIGLGSKFCFDCLNNEIH